MTQTGATQCEELDREWLDDFTERWEAAWNSHEPEPLLELMTEDIVYDDSAWPRTMRGHADVREFLEFTWRAFPDLRFDMSDGPYMVPGRPKAAFHWRRGAARTAGRSTHPDSRRTGKQVEFEGADFHEYRDGRVCRLRIVFDMMDVTRQLGLLPKPGSPVEKAGAAAQRLGVKVQQQVSPAAERAYKTRTSARQLTGSRYPSRARQTGRIAGLSNGPAPSGILRSRPQITLVKRGSWVRIPPSASGS